MSEKINKNCPSCNKKHIKFPLMCWNEARNAYGHMIILFHGQHETGKNGSDAGVMLETLEREGHTYPSLNIDGCKEQIKLYAAMKQYIVRFPKNPLAKI
jgi:hypothetical protein